MQNILVPIDFSTCATNALNYAIEIAQRTGATLHLLHVVFPSQSIHNSTYDALWIDEYLENRKKNLKKLVARIHKKNGSNAVSIKTYVEIGYPTMTIDQLAGETKADLIILGTKGATGLKDAFLGSTAGNLITKTKTPMLVIPPKAKYLEGAKIAFATDFRVQLDPNSKAVLIELLKIHDANLEVLHVFDKSTDVPDKEKERVFMQKINGIKANFHYLHDTNKINAVANFIESIQANGLISIAHDHGIWHKLFFESTTRAIAHRIQVPMIVLHDS